jgi:hypothetical protein
MNSVNLPGFTAEASLYNPSGQYWIVRTLNDPAGNSGLQPQLRVPAFGFRRTRFFGAVDGDGCACLTVCNSKGENCTPCSCSPPNCGTCA